MRAELDRILASAEFRGSERRSRLLKYLVEKAIAGEPVKEYIIGVDVFDKSSDYDPRIDPAVRVEMSRVRARLADYYAGEGKANRERLEFPKRNYAPALRRAEPSTQVPLRANPLKAWRPGWLVATLGLAMLVSAGAVGWRFETRSAKPPDNPEARQLCAKARFFWNKRTPEALRTSLELYQQAIRQWPKYAPAYAGEALCYAVMATNSELPAEPTSSEAIDAAKAAIALDPTVAEAHAALGWLAYAVHADWKTADMELERAEELDPSFATAHQWRALSLLYVGKTDEAAPEMAKALHLDPVSMPLLAADGMISYFSRRYDEAVEKARRLLAMDPAFREAHLMLGEALEAKHEWAGAESEFHTVVLASSGDMEGVARLAHLYALTGRTDESKKMLAKLLNPAPDQYVDPYQLAFVLTALGEKERGLEWLEKAVRQHTATIMKVDPYLDPLRHEPRFAQLLAEAHLN
jgi:tetratricopeptide (TPR) repeat protein